jgi:excinuclease ABC subunit C
MISARGELIYVGKAKSLRARLLSYFRPRSRDPKAGRILAQTRSLVWEAVPSEFAALLRELELIRRWRPRFNVQGQPRRRRRVYVCVGRQPAPYVFLSRRPPAGALACFGPVPAAREAREAVRWLNDLFQLRDCPQSQEMIFAEQAELFPVLRAAGCLRHEIGTCLGPCVAVCTRQAYGEHVRAVRAFLDGTERTVLDRLEQDMQQASLAQAFERAAALRDRLAALTWLRERLDRLREVRQGDSVIYPVPGADGQHWWYLIRDGMVVRVLTAPRTPEEGRLALRTVRTVFRETNAWPRVPACDEVDGLLLVAAWFRRYPEERSRLILPETALAACGLARRPRSRGRRITEA